MTSYINPRETAYNLAFEKLRVATEELLAEFSRPNGPDPKRARTLADDQRALAQRVAFLRRGLR